MFMSKSVKFLSVDFVQKKLLEQTFQNSDPFPRPSLSTALEGLHFTRAFKQGIFEALFYGVILGSTSFIKDWWRLTHKLALPFLYRFPIMSGFAGLWKSTIN